MSCDRTYGYGEYGDCFYGGAMPTIEGYLETAHVAAANVVWTSVTLPAATSMFWAIELVPPPSDGHIHSMVAPGGGSVLALAYFPYSTGVYYFYFFNINATWSPVSVTIAMFNAVGIDPLVRGQYKLYWDDALKTLTLYARQGEEMHRELEDPIGWVFVRGVSVPTMALPTGTRGFGAGTYSTQFGGHTIYRLILQYEGDVEPVVDLDFRHLMEQPGTTLLLPSGQTASIIRNVTNPLTFTLAIPGDCEPCFSNDGCPEQVPSASGPADRLQDLVPCPEGGDCA